MKQIKDKNLIPPEKRQQIIDVFRLFQIPYKNGIQKKLQSCQIEHLIMYQDL